MQKYFDSVTDRYGNAVVNASVRVTVTATGVLATIYSDNGVTTQVNPMTTDINGYFSFFADDGKYTLSISGPAITTRSITNVLLEDVTDGVSPLQFPTYAAMIVATISGPTEILVLADETNGGARTLYFYDGVAFSRIQMVGTTVPGVSSRAPKSSDAKGYSTASVWQYAGQLYKPVAAPTATASTWGVLPRLAAGIGDVVGSTNTKFVGGTVAMRAGFTGAAIEATFTISTVATPVDINILPDGTLDNLTLQKYAAIADSGTDIKVTKIYDQFGSGATLAQSGAVVPPILVWDEILRAYVIVGTSNPNAVGALKFSAGVTATRNAFSMVMMGRGLNACSDNGTSVIAVLGDFQGGANPIASWQANVQGSQTIANNPTGGNKIPPSPVPIETTPCVIGVVSDTATTTFFCNETQSSLSAANLSTALSSGWVGNDTGTGFRLAAMRYTGIAVYNVALSANQITAIKRSAYTRMNLYPQVINQTFFLGDSRTAGAKTTAGGNLAIQTAAQITLPTKIISFGNGGYTSAQVLSTQVPTAISLYNSNAKNIAVVLVGVNDFIASGLSVAQSQANVAAVCSALKNAGFYVILITELATTNMGGNANTNLPLLRAAMNAAGAAGMGASILVDVSALPSVSTPANTIYYPDGLHQSTSTNTEIGSILGPVIDAALSMP